MYFDWAYFAANTCIMCCGAFLCLFTLREKVKMPLIAVSLIAAGLIALFCGAVSLQRADIMNILMPVILAPCFLCYQKVVAEETSKLLFLFFLVCTYICFASDAALLLMHILPETMLFAPPDPGYMGLDAMAVSMAVSLALVFPAYYLLRKKIWPLIRDLPRGEARLLWIVPMVFTLVIVAYTQQMGSMGLDFWLYMLIILLLGVGGAVSCYLILGLMARADQSARAQEQARMMGLQLTIQREQYQALSDGIMKARQARHDLRHALAALQGFAQAGDVAGLRAYLGQLMGALPQDAEQPLCDNYAVNAVARHYLGIAKNQGATVSARLEVPPALPPGLELDLCVLLGNMLENAQEACQRMTTGRREISAASFVDGQYLTILVANTFDGRLDTAGGAYLSRKHEGEGIGLNSIRAIAHKYGGYAANAVHGDRFEMSAVVGIVQTNDNA